MNGVTARKTLALGGRLGLAAILVACLVLPTTPAFGIDLAEGKDFKLNLNTTLNWGTAYRVEDRDMSIISPFEGGTAWSVNGDDGNLNFDKGMFSNAVERHRRPRVSRTRTSASSSAAAASTTTRSRRRRPSAYAAHRRGAGLGRQPRRAARRLRLVQVQARQHARQVRAGQQVLNWGESTFIQSGLSSINPIDVPPSACPAPSSARRSGRSAWSGARSTSSESVSVRGASTSTTGRRSSSIRPARTSRRTTSRAAAASTCSSHSRASPIPARSPWFVAAAGGRPVHERAPQRRPRRRTTTASTGSPCAGLRVRPRRTPSSASTTSTTTAGCRSLTASPGTLQGAMDAQAAGPGRRHGRLPVLRRPARREPRGRRRGRAARLRRPPPLRSPTPRRWYTAYPEDIKLYGLSWNTQLGTSGIAFQGEVSYRQDVPFLVDDVELLFASLSPISAGLAATNQVVPGGVGLLDPASTATASIDASQFQFTMTKVFGPMLGADQAPARVRARLELRLRHAGQERAALRGTGTYTSGNPIHRLPAAPTRASRTSEAEHFADATSWGYRLAGRLDYNNALGAWNLSPRFGWQHDVNGVSPGPGGNFVEGLYAAHPRPGLQLPDPLGGRFQLQHLRRRGPLQSHQRPRLRRVVVKYSF